MKSNPNKIILIFVTAFLLNSCHTFHHQNIFLNNLKKAKDQKTEKIDRKTKGNVVDKEIISKNTQLAPIKVPKQKEKVKTAILDKKISMAKTKKFELDRIKNWSEKKLIRIMGQSDFIKKEGRLKNYQYYFSNCFLDIFLTRKKNDYFVTYILTRSTKLYGKVVKDKCMKEITNKLNKKL